jgi:hypothetical protein
MGRGDCPCLAGTLFICESLKATLKVPRPVSMKQHPEAIDTFKKTSDWP